MDTQQLIWLIHTYIHIYMYTYVGAYLCVSRACQGTSRFTTWAETHHHSSSAKALSPPPHLRLTSPSLTLFALLLRLRAACPVVRLGGRLQQRARCCELESVTSITSVQSEPYTGLATGRLLNREVWTAGHKLVGLHASSIIPLLLSFILLFLSFCLPFPPFFLLSFKWSINYIKMAKVQFLEVHSSLFLHISSVLILHACCSLKQVLWSQLVVWLKKEIAASSSGIYKWPMNASILQDKMPFGGFQRNTTAVCGNHTINAQGHKVIVQGWCCIDLLRLLYERKRCADFKNKTKNKKIKNKNQQLCVHDWPYLDVYVSLFVH